MHDRINQKEKRSSARELIEKGLREEFKRGMLSFDAILQQWKSENSDIKENYYKIFSAVKDFDKGIARGDMMECVKVRLHELVIVGQLMDELYDISELNEFSPETKDGILRMIKWRKGL